MLYGIDSFIWILLIQHSFYRFTDGVGSRQLDKIALKIGDVSDIEGFS